MSYVSVKEAVPWHSGPSSKMYQRTSELGILRTAKDTIHRISRYLDAMGKIKPCIVGLLSVTWYANRCQPTVKRASFWALHLCMPISEHFCGLCMAPAVATSQVHSQTAGRLVGRRNHSHICSTSMSSPTHTHRSGHASFTGLGHLWAIGVQLNTSSGQLRFLHLKADVVATAGWSFHP